MKTNSYTPNNISRREQEVLRLIADEHNSHQIAEELCVSYETAQSHRKSLRKKLKVKNTAGMVRVAFELGLLRLGQQVAMVFLLVVATQFSLVAQVTNGNKINYEVKIGELEWNLGNNDGEGQTADPTWLFRYNTSSSYSNLSCISSDFSSYSKCFHWEDDRGPHRPNHLAFRESDVADNRTVYMAYYAFENDVGSNCAYGGSDDVPISYCGAALPAKNGKPSTFNFTEHLHTTQNRTYSTVWRYHHGNSFSDPLDFGSFSIGEKSHENSNRSHPLFEDDAITSHPSTGYTNTDNDASPDVWYKFTIPFNDIAKKVTITTDYAQTSQTDFDTELWLYNAARSNITNNDDIDGVSNRQSRIIQNLCPGTYVFSVEGHSTNTGDFKVSVNLSDVEGSSAIDKGSITATTTALCTGQPLPPITNTTYSSLIQLYGGTHEGYNWYKREGSSGGWNKIPDNRPGQEQYQLIQTGNMGNNDISFVRTAIWCGVESEHSNTVTIPRIQGKVGAGAIALTGSQVIKQGDDPGQFISTTAGTSDPGSPIYQWVSSTTSDVVSSMNHIDEATGEVYDVGPLNTTTYFSRKTIGGCSNNPAFTQPITITVIPANGIVKGKVTAPPFGSGVPISGVQVCATPINNPPVGSVQKCTMTLDSPGSMDHGTYEIPGLYYGNGTTTFRVSATLTGHDICIDELCNNETKEVELSYNGTIERVVDFVDTTAYIIKGNIYHNFDLDDNPGTQDDRIGKGQVEIHVNGTPKTITDANGDYELTIENAGIYNIEPKLIDIMNTAGQHVFNPSNRNVEVTEDTYGVDFEDITVSNLSGSVTAGCSKFFGRVDVRIFQDAADGTFEYTFKTNSTDGIFMKTFPANKYKIEIKGENILMPDYDWTNVYEAQDVINQLSALAYSADLTYQDTTIIAQYKAPVEIELIGIPSSDCFSYPVLEQGNVYTDFKIMVWEGPIGQGCKLDTGAIFINDGIGDRGSDTGPIKSGEVEFELLAGNPKLGGNHLKTLFMTAKSLNPADPGNSKSLKVLVTGVKANDAFGITTSPALPLLILHDPPGDESFVEYTSEETFEVATRTYSKSTDEDNIWEKLKLGVDIGNTVQVFGVGISLQTEIWGQGGADFTVSETQVSSEESILSLTRSTTYSTSTLDDFTGEQGDVFIGMAINYKYSSATKLFLDENCQIKKDIDNIADPFGIETNYVLSASAIADEIEVFKGLIITDPAKATFYQNQIDVWNQWLEQNRERKAQAIADPSLLLGSYTNDAGAGLSVETTSFTSTSSSYEFVMEIDTTITGEWKSEIAGNGVNGGLYFKFKTEIGKSETRDTLRRLTTKFTLDDDDTGDIVTTRVYQDPVYKTPIFDVFSGRTSCPYEPGTTRRDNFEVEPITNTTEPDIPANGQGIYRIRIFNFFNQNRRFIVRSVGSYNQEGADISITSSSGGNANSAFTVPADGSIDVTISVSKESSSPIFSYTGLRIEVLPECQADDENFITPDETLAQYVDLNAFFQTTCSDINIGSPDPNRVIKIADNNTINLLIDSYDKPSLDRVVLEYTKAGAGAWNSSAEIDFEKDSLSGLPSGKLTTWNTDELVDDGPYDIRLKVICGTTINYSMIVPILMDRTKPEAFGIPGPIDDDYDISLNDEIYVNFNEEVRLINPNQNNQAQIINMLTGEVEPASVTLFGNQVKVTPTTSLAPSFYRVILEGIEDVNDNPANTYKWVFSVGDVDIQKAFCLNLLDISNNNENQDAINIDNYRAIIISSNGQLPKFGATTYTAQTEIELTEGFEVQAGGVFLAEIDACVVPEPCGTIVSSLGTADAPSDGLRWDISEDATCVTSILSSPGNPNNADIEVDVNNFVNPEDPSHVNVSLELNMPSGATVRRNVVLDSNGHIENMGIYTAANGKQYQIEIELIYYGNRLVEAIISMEVIIST